MSDSERPKCGCEPKTFACWEHYFYYDRPLRGANATAISEQAQQREELQPQSAEDAPE